MKVSTTTSMEWTKSTFHNCQETGKYHTRTKQKVISLSWRGGYEAEVQEMPFDVQLLASYCVVPNGTQEAREPKIPKLKSTLPPSLPGIEPGAPGVTWIVGPNSGVLESNVNECHLPAVLGACLHHEPWSRTMEDGLFRGSNVHGPIS